MKRMTTAIMLVFVGFALLASQTEGVVGTLSDTKTLAPQNVPPSPLSSGERIAALKQDGSATYADVAPIFNQRCIMCHKGDTPPAGLRMDAYADIMKGSLKGPVIVGGNPAQSELLRRIRGQSVPRMPLSGPPWLTKDEETKIEQWIAAGAPEGTPSPDEKKATLDVSPQAPPKPDDVTYADVAPIFNSRCVKCHAHKGLMGPAPEGIRLDTYDSIFAGSERSVVVPGSPDASQLVRAVRGQSSPRMPYDGPPYLTETEIALITKWIAEHAPDSNGKKRPVPVGASVRLEGHLTGTWALDGMTLVVDKATRLQKGPSVGDYVEVRGVVLEDGRIHATRIRPR